MQPHSVARRDEIPPGGRKIVTVGKVSLGIFNVGGEFHAYRNVCPHAGAAVCLGKVGGTSLPSGVYEYEFGREGGILRCPWHGWEFDLKTGEHLVDPETRLKKIAVADACPAESGEESLESFPVEVRDDALYVLLPG